MPDALVCDALLDQTVFAGVGNIIKNEVLFRIRVHPLSTLGALPPAKLRVLVAEARQYSFDFLAWKRDFVLRQHWLVHNKGTCARCGRKLTRAHLGHTDRRTFFCTHCQKLHVSAARRVPPPKSPAGAKASLKQRRKVAKRQPVPRKRKPAARR
jgi:endonuclease-8